MDRGKWIIIGIFGTALAMGVFAWQYRIQSGDQVIAYWGIEPATRLRHAAHIEFLQLSDTAADGSSLQINDAQRHIESVIDITNRKGLIHARHMFISDHSYLWNTPVSNVAKRWDFALRFRDGSAEVTLAFDIQTHSVQMLGKNQPLVMGPMFDNLLYYLSPLLEPASGSGSSLPSARGVQ